MKPALSVLLILWCAFVPASAFAASAPSAKAAPTPATHDRVELKVVKVFSARDGDFVYRAYLVEWNGQEVVVDDTLAATNHRVGDVINVMVLRQTTPNGNRQLLQFALGPPRREPPPPAKDAKAKR